MHVLVLPPRERFTAAEAGAIATIVRIRARHLPGPVLVVGPPVARPFDVPFLPVRPVFGLSSGARRYARGVVRALAGRDVRQVEVHNRPDVALVIAAGVAAPVTLVLNNDPRDMRGARTAAERVRLTASLARVVGVSDWVSAHMPGADTVLNPIDLSELPAPAAERDRLILFAGRLVADKGADLFVRACAAALPHLPGWRAAMIGADRFSANSPETPFLRALRPAAAAAGVELLGHRPRPEVLATMAQAAMVVVPGRWPEPFGMVALEAMACGAPVLFAPRGGLPEVVAEAGVAIDPEDFAEMLVALARDPERLAMLSVAGRSRARTFDARHLATASA